MITTVSGLVRVINKGVVAATKRQNTFVKNFNVALHTECFEIFHQK